MSGSATLTIVMSIALMNIAQQMTPSPSHRLSSPMVSCAAGAGAKWMKCGTSMAGLLLASRPAPQLPRSGRVRAGGNGREGVSVHEQEAAFRRARRRAADSGSGIGVALLGPLSAASPDGDVNWRGVVAIVDHHEQAAVVVGAGHG